MRLVSRLDTPSPEGTDARMATLETRAYAALALAIIGLATQFVMAVFIFKIWLKARESRKPADTEQGLELGNVSRGPAPRRPQAPAAVSPVGPTMSSAHGRPVAAYNIDDVHGEAEDYYHPRAPVSGGYYHPRAPVPGGYYHPRAPVSGGARPGRQPTWTVDSGRGDQTHGADYTSQPRGSRFGDDGPHRTNTNDADYGRRGNRFAHGT